MRDFDDRYDDYFDRYERNIANHWEEIDDYEYYGKMLNVPPQTMLYEEMRDKGLLERKER